MTARIEGSWGRDLAASRSRTEYITALIVAEFPTVTVRMIHSTRRDANIALARQTVWWVLYQSTRLSYPWLAAHFRRHHTTILHGVRKIAELRSADPRFKEMTDRLADAAAKVPRTGMTNGSGVIDVMLDALRAALPVLKNHMSMVETSQSIDGMITRIAVDKAKGAIAVAEERQS